MSEFPQQPDFVPLTGAPVPPLDAEQLAKFTPEAMHIEKVMEFDPAQAVESLAAQEGKQVVAADFGGDKGTSRLFKIQNGNLIVIDGYEDNIQGDHGQGYVASLVKSAGYAEEHGLPFGISWGGPIDCSKPVFHPKATAFYNDLNVQFNGDLQAISPAVKAILNDGPAGVISGAVEAYRQFNATNILFIINGGGIGLGVLRDGVILATEAGHIEGLPILNTYNQTEACGLFDADYVCLERLGANKAGIEAQWQAKTGEYMRARDIEDRYKAGDQFAGELYDHSALVAAHILQGSAVALGLNLADEQTVIVGHGGAFKFPGYGQRIKQILDQAIGAESRLIMTKDYGDATSNACLDGAAIAALTA